MFNFGEAVEALKVGKLVTRAGWNGRGMFIFMRPSDTVTVAQLVTFKSLPTEVKKYYENQFAHTINEANNGKSMTDVQVTFTGYLCMKAADGTIVNGWLASQTDMLSDDWMIFDDLKQG